MSTWWDERALPGWPVEAVSVDGQRVRLLRPDGSVALETTLPPMAPPRVLVYDAALWTPLLVVPDETLRDPIVVYRLLGDAVWLDADGRIVE